MNGQRIRLASLSLLAMVAACAPIGGLTNGAVTTGTDAVALRATTALSLAELAYNSAEAGASAAVQSGALSPAQDAAIGAAIDRARGYRNQARALVAADSDAAGAIESLDAALVEIAALAHPQQQ